MSHIKQIPGGIEEHLNFLDWFRDSGIIDPHGPSPYLQTTFPDIKGDDEATKIIRYWEKL